MSKSLYTKSENVVYFSVFLTILLLEKYRRWAYFLSDFNFNYLWKSSFGNKNNLRITVNYQLRFCLHQSQTFLVSKGLSLESGGGVNTAYNKLDLPMISVFLFQGYFFLFKEKLRKKP